MVHLFLKALFELMRIDYYAARGSFSDLHALVRNSRLQDLRLLATSDQVCYAVDLACVWYWKRVLCLQRAAATTCLLKRCGISAQMIIGVQQLPFKAHAWVEVNGQVVNDKPYVREIYAVLDRC